MSHTFIEYGSSNVSPGAVIGWFLSPRLMMVSWWLSVTSAVKRVQRVQLMQRSASRTTLGPSWTRLGLWTFWNSKREPSGPYL